MLSSVAHAEWTKVVNRVNGDSYYVDFKRVSKHKGFVYFWYLEDYLKPTKYGDLSGKFYKEGDCVRFGYKFLYVSLHTKPMGEGTPSSTNNNPAKERSYPPPDSVMEGVLGAVCAYKKP